MLDCVASRVSVTLSTPGDLEYPGLNKREQLRQHFASSPQEGKPCLSMEGHAALRMEQPNGPHHKYKIQLGELEGLWAAL